MAVSTTGAPETLGRRSDDDGEGEAGLAELAALEAVRDEKRRKLDEAAQLAAGQSRRPKLPAGCTKADLPASCRPNRGPKGAPLFLINHWVSTDPTPRPSDARKVNAYAPLLARARACDRIRDHQPNLLAVNFYKRGDVFKVADTLNGV